MEKLVHKSEQLKFFDFCSGIGSGRQGLVLAGMQPVGYSEINTSAEKTYQKIFGNTEKNFGNLMEIKSKDLPKFDLMLAGFPCQTFSIAGKRAGFNDSRGQVIYGLVKILKEKKTPYFILENVKGLINHDKGNTLKIILEELVNLGYTVYYHVLNSLDFGVAQFRERVYLIGFLNKHKEFEWPAPIKSPKLDAFLCDTQDTTDSADLEKSLEHYLGNKYNNNSITCTELLQKELCIIDARQSDLRLYQDYCPTIRTGRQGLLYVKNGKLRRLSGYEGLLLQGFDKKQANKLIGISNNTLLAQVGNAMTVSVIKTLGESLVKSI